MVDRTLSSLLLIGLVVAFASPISVAQTLAPMDLVTSLREGGYVIVMRHASSPRETPTTETARPDNVKLERQLDEAGRNAATAMGRALRDLQIPVGDVLSSPTYRAMETVRLAALPNPQPVAELGDGGQSMQVAAEAQAVNPNLAGAFPDWGSTVADGEAVIFRPDGKGGTTIVTRIKIEDWQRLH